MRESRPYRKFTTLTELDLSRMLREMEALPWSEVETKTLGKRSVAWLRVTDAGRNEIPAAEAAFRYVEAIRQAPCTLAVLRRLGFALGARLDDLGSAYVSRMSPGDVVPPHADDYSPYYSGYHRVQVVLKQSPDAAFAVGGDSIATQPRDCGVFDNLLEHSVQAGSGERCVLLVDVRARALANGLTMEFAQ